MDEVRISREGRALVATIDRPARRNAIDGRTADALVDALETAERDPDVAVFVLTGAGGAFCAGADLTALETLRVGGADGPLGFTRRLPAKPTIAAVDGWAVAGGLELALWCDLRVCTPRSVFGCLERRFGVPLIDGGTVRLPRVVGLGRALDLILTGRTVDAVEAAAIGLVTEVADDALARALALAELLAGFPQPTLLADRRSVYDGLGLPLSDALRREADLGEQTLAVAAEGAARFAGGAGRGGTSVG